MLRDSTICPLEWRYGSSSMRALLSRENFIKKMISVEIALLLGLAKAGLIPRDIAQKVRELSIDVSTEKLEKLERELGHEVMALVTMLSEQLGEASKYLHIGATSNDIIDTAWALILKEALSIVKSKLRELIEILMILVNKYRDLIMIGRTHGQHALPITLGFKLANYVYEFSRSYERICEVEKRVVRGKISGAVGTMAAWRDKGLLVEKYTLEILGLEPHIISTQIAPRDGFAELMTTLAILASQLDRLALEIRELMRPEILELAESVESRVGSSTMPHKQNPVICERISGLAKVLRSLVITALENIPLWHERDLTNSSSERIVIPHTLMIIDEMLNSMISVLKNLRVYPENMKKNLKLLRGVNMAEAVMISLVIDKGIARNIAYNHLMHLARKAISEGKEFEEILKNDELIRKYLTEKELKQILRPENYLGSINELINRSLDYARSILKRL